MGTGVLGSRAPAAAAECLSVVKMDVDSLVRERVRQRQRRVGHCLEPIAFTLTTMESKREP